MKYIAVIPARGGSKRFPGKNLHPLGHRPLITYSIEYAKSCSKISDVYVTTDSEAIAQVSICEGAKVICRPEELAGDFVSTAEVLQHVVLFLQARDVIFDYVVLLQPTNPLRPVNLLTNAIGLLETGQYDSLMCISPSDKKLGKIVDGKFCPWNYNYGQRSQDMSPLYYENGLLYISSKSLLSEGKIIGKEMYPLIVNHVFGEIDIDTREDMLYAEYILERYGKE